jgi:hypothetical protein
MTKSSSRDKLSFRRFQFAPITLVDPDDYDTPSQGSSNPTDMICEDEKVIKSLGTIQVDIIRANLIHRPRQPSKKRAAPATSTNQMKFSERSKKARLLNTAGLSDTSPSNGPPHPMQWHIKKEDPKPFLQVIHLFFFSSLLSLLFFFYHQPNSCVFKLTHSFSSDSFFDR